MKLYLTIEYDVLGENKELEDYHRELLENDPIEFINSVCNLDNVQFEYCLESSKKSNNLALEFDCELYFYTEVDGNICKKYGALCSNFLCVNMK